MLPVSIGVGPISFSTFGIFAAFSFVVASFMLWRTLRDDYLEEEILTFTILVTLFLLLGGRIFYAAEHFADFNFSLGKWIFFTRFPGFSLVGAYFGVALFAFWWSRKKEWDFWLLVDILMPVLLVVFLLGSFGVSPPTFPQKVLLGALTLVLSFFLVRYYRKLIWYKSGKPGFAACSCSAIFFLGIFVLDFFRDNRLYLELAGAVLIVALALVFLYQRSGRNLKEDLAVLGNTLGGKFIQK